jgi:hypothetical protein
LLDKLIVQIDNFVSKTTVQTKDQIIDSFKRDFMKILRTRRNDGNDNRIMRTARVLVEFWRERAKNLFKIESGRILDDRLRAIFEGCEELIEGALGKVNRLHNDVKEEADTFERVYRKSYTEFEENQPENFRKTKYPYDFRDIFFSRTPELSLKLTAVSKGDIGYAQPDLRKGIAL